MRFTFSHAAFAATFRLRALVDVERRRDSSLMWPFVLFSIECVPLHRHYIIDVFFLSFIVSNIHTFTVPSPVFRNAFSFVVAYVETFNGRQLSFTSISHKGVCARSLARSLSLSLLIVPSLSHSLVLSPVSRRSVRAGLLHRKQLSSRDFTYYNVLGERSLRRV